MTTTITTAYIEANHIAGQFVITIQTRSEDQVTEKSWVMKLKEIPAFFEKHPVDVIEYDDMLVTSLQEHISNNIAAYTADKQAE